MQTAKYSCWTGSSYDHLNSPRSTIPSPSTSSPVMSSGSRSTSPTTTSTGIRRHRRTTACTTCRDRRVKCSRQRPACTQCEKGNRPCHYLNSETPEFEFIQVRAPRKISKSPSPEHINWKPVLERHYATIKNMSSAPISPESKGFPSWMMANSKELPRIKTPEINTRQQVAYRLSALGENYLSSFKEKLPARAVCDHFLESFRLSIQPLIPVCHMPVLEKEYTNFWRDMSSSTSIESMLLILAVLYTGASNSTINISQSTTLHKLYEEFLSIVKIPTYQVCNRESAVQLLQAYIIVNTFELSTPGRSESVYSFLPDALRLARLLNMHNLPTIHTKYGTDYQNRIWWHLLFLDVENCIATGSQRMIQPAEYTTGLPSLIAEPNSMAPFTSMMVAMQGQWQWTSRMQSWFHKMPTQEEVKQFIALIQNLLDLIPDGRSENEWARSYLTLLIDRTYCMIGLKFWLGDQLNGKGCNSDVLSAARSFLHNYQHISTLPQSAHLQWFTTCFAHPHHATFVLLMHISSCANLSNESTLSRTLIEQAFSTRSSSTTSPSKTEHPNPPNHRQESLAKLFNKVWKKTGWNIPARNSASSSPKIGVLPGLDVLMREERSERQESVESLASSSAASASGSSWMELVNGRGAESFELERLVDEVVRSGEGWQRLAQRIFMA